MSSKLLIAYFLISTRVTHAAIQVEGHLEMGENVARFFNDIVDQFSPPPPPSTSPALYVPYIPLLHNQQADQKAPSVHVGHIDTPTLNEELMKLDSAWTTSTNMKDLQKMLKHEQAKVNEDETDGEEPLLEKIMRDTSFPGVIHIYGHHKLTAMDNNNTHKNSVHL